MATLEQAASRFGSAGFERASRYQEGTAGKGAAWESSKARAKVNFAPAMQEALQKDAFGKGLDKAKGSDYDRGVQDKGVTNWGTGMQAGSQKYRERIQPFTNLWGAALPTAKGPRRSPNNLKRMQENVQRFVQTAGK